MSGYVRDCELEGQKRKSGTQALNSGSCAEVLLGHKRKLQNFIARVNRKLNKPRRSVFYYQSKLQIKTHSAARASFKFKPRFAGELQTKPVRQILSICAINLTFIQPKLRTQNRDKQDQINSFSKGCIALPSASKSTRPQTSQTSSLGEGSSASSCHADISPHSQFMT